MFKPQSLPQPELFVASCRLAQPATFSFYAKLELTLQSFAFAAQVRELCADAYSDNGRGRPGVDPVVYFKMLMVGFFENLPSERGIAERCQDSISIRAFLGYDLTGDTPDHSTLSVIRSRLGVEKYDQVFVLILCALQEHGLVKGRNVGIDASVIEANASLKGLVNRQTEEAYWDYVRRLAAENGIDPKDADAVRRFDRKRPKKMSNRDWENPNDPDAKIGPTKAGATDMIYKPETTVDLDTGAILHAEVRPGDEPDQKDLAAHVLEAQENINAAKDLPVGSLTIESATADKGYHAVAEMGFLQQEGIRTVISDPVINRHLDKLTDAEAKVVRSARRSAKSKSGKELLKRRGMHLERPFAHILDAGGARRTTLRGRLNLNKRFKFSAAIYNLSQLMRKLLGVGTPKQWVAWGKALFCIFGRLLQEGVCWLTRNIVTELQTYGQRLVARVEVMAATIFRASPARPNYDHCSTGC
jgi:transposase